MIDEFTNARLRGLITQYLEAPARRDNHVSVSAARRAVELVHPGHGIPRHAPDNLIAALAIDRGLCVDFDHQSDEGRLAVQG